MRRWRRFLIIVGLLATMAVPLGNGPVRAQADAAERSDEAAVERLRERAERVQERRKARVTQAQREAAAERAKAAREKGAAPGTAPVEAAPDKDGKGDAQ